MLAALAGVRVHVATYKDYYKIMGVARDASQDEIKRVYRRLARKFHPDVSKEANAEDKFKEVQEAYEVLKDPAEARRVRPARLELARRARSSARRRTGAGTSNSPPRRSAARRAMAASAISSRRCSAQRSPFGAVSAAAVAAAAASPRPAKITSRRSRSTWKTRFAAAAQTIELKAPQLGEDGHVTVQPRTLKVTIPAGVIEGQRIRLAGQGSPGIGGGPAGDLYLEIGFRPHRLFKVDGRDVTLTLPIAPWEAALGATVQTPTLAGPVDLRIPPNAKAGQKMRLKGRGLPGATPGDQYVVLKIVLPPADTPQARKSSTSRCSASCRSIRARS